MPDAPHYILHGVLIRILSYTEQVRLVNSGFYILG